MPFSTTLDKKSLEIDLWLPKDKGFKKVFFVGSRWPTTCLKLSGRKTEAKKIHIKPEILRQSPYWLSSVWQCFWFLPIRLYAVLIGACSFEISRVWGFLLIAAIHAVISLYDFFLFELHFLVSFRHLPFSFTHNFHFGRVYRPQLIHWTDWLITSWQP